MFSLNCAWINGWVNNHEAGDLRRHRTHYDVIVMTREMPWKGWMRLLTQVTWTLTCDGRTKCWHYKCEISLKFVLINYWQTPKSEQKRNPDMGIIYSKSDLDLTFTTILFRDPDLKSRSGTCLIKQGLEVTGSAAWLSMLTQIARFMGPTWGPPGSYRPQMGPILALWILLSE